ncbi:ribonuclease [Ruminococcaceae bacterium OttesenSCG-928-N02]|nr:ribonuclease [Ruminococcaceae bacterium OttesenSCG-928-N02]
MIKRKSNLLLALTLLFSFLLVACGNDAQGPNGSRESSLSQLESSIPQDSQGDSQSIQDSMVLDENGSYTTAQDVALYIHTYGHLPANFITKSEARALGWQGSEGNLWDVAPGMSIGGDFFGNYEELLPQGDWRECDIDYAGGYRGPQRIIYGKDGSIYYTQDHYESFTQLY